MSKSFLTDECPPMGIYETLYAFADTFGSFMGTKDTHPWSQGFPLTTQLENGPPLPSSVEVTWEDRFAIPNPDPKPRPKSNASPNSYPCPNHKKL